MIRQEKIELAQKINQEIQKKSFGIVLSHKKLKFSEVDQVKKTLKDTTLIVKIKNKIAKKAFKGSVFEKIGENLSQENIFIFGEDPFDTCAAAQKLKSSNATINILQATSQEGEMDLRYIAKLSELGSKENLQSKLLNVISEIISKLLRVLHAKTTK